MLKRLLFTVACLLFVQLAVSAQYRFEGYNVIVDAPRDHTSATCALRYPAQSTAVTITDLDPSTPLKVRQCGGSAGSLRQTGASTALLSNAGDKKSCFEGEDKQYKVSFQGDRYSGQISYTILALSDERTRGFFNIRDFGAAGDGMTDDTAAFKSAMAAIGSNNGGTLTIPDGDYVITSSVTVPSGIIIQGTNGLHSLAATSNITRKNPARLRLKRAGTALLRVGECTEHVTLRDLELYSDSSDGTSGIEMMGAWNTSQGFNFDRVSFSNFNRGIHAYGLPQTNLNWQIDYIKVNACRFVMNRDAGIWVNARNTDWKITGSFFTNPKRGPGQAANSMHFERVGLVLIEDTFGGGFPGALGGTFIDILDSGPTTIIGSQTEAMTNSIVFNEVNNPLAGDYTFPITIVNSIFGDPIVFKGRRTLVSTGSYYLGNTFRTDDRLRVYSTGDRFCYDGYIVGCQNYGKNNFDKASVIFMTGQPSEGSVTGHPTYFGYDTKMGAPLQLAPMPVNTLPQGKANGSLVYCSDCRRNTTPCQGGGSGAPAMVIGNQWSCF